jgi:hypothetical protein
MFLNIDLNSEKKSDIQIEPIKNVLISENQHFQNVPKENYNYYKESNHEKINQIPQNIHDVLHSVPYIPLPRFFVIKSVDEDNILKV